MREDNRKFMIYMVVAFTTAWALQIAGVLLGQPMYQILVGLCMYMPLIGVLAAEKGLKKDKSGILWKFRFKKSWKYYLIAWFLPAVLALLGGVLYFVVFPEKFDPDLGMIAAMSADMMDADGTVQGMSLQTIAAIQIVAAVGYAPLINALTAIGEEAGWRGYMTPVLQRKLGRKPALIVSGIIWAIWHAPLIVLAGYEYGTGYAGAPFLGILMMCGFTTAFGILLSFFYEKSQSIWVPAIMHGAVNGAVGIPMLFLKEMPRHYLLGPTLAGLLSGIPLFILAAILFVKMTGKKEKDIVL